MPYGAIDILICEDDDDDYYIFSTAVTDIPFLVTLARVKDGEALMKQLMALLPDILFLDLLIPRKSGWQCLREIRANPAYDGMPVIIYSSLENMENIQFCYKEKAARYICKPSSFEGLKSILLSIFKAQWHGPAPSLNQFVIRELN